MSTDGRRERLRGDQALEVLAVVLLGLATVGTAWCGFQASRWGGEETRSSRRSSDLRVESSRLFGLATQFVQYDTGVASDYAQALAADDEELARFVRDSLSRDEFVATLDEWREAYRAGENPNNLLDDPDYIEEQFRAFNEADAASEVEATVAEAAAKTSDDYVQATVFLAVALFFAGVTGSFRYRTPRLLLLAGTGIIIAVTAATLVDLPVA